MPREHRLKSLPPYFRAVIERRKPFEIRKDDRAFDEGDVLVLCEWEPMEGFTGAEVRTPVTYVMRGGDLGLDRGYAILGIDIPEVYSPATEEQPALPPSLQSAAVAGDVPKDSHEDPEPREQVAGVEGSDMRDGPAHAPEQDREAGVQRPAGSAVPGEGATASPAAARWGAVNAAGAAWHLWRDRERAECGETFRNMGVTLLPEGTFPDPDYTCLDCRDLAGTVLPEGAADVEVLGSTARVVDEEGNDLAILGDVHEPAAREVIAKARATLATRPRCAGFNKSAGVPCNTRHVHVERDGKWFCKRHDPAKPRKAVAA